jgi:hypothetical protein
VVRGTDPYGRTGGFYRDSFTLLILWINLRTLTTEHPNTMRLIIGLCILLRVSINIQGDYKRND